MACTGESPFARLAARPTLMAGRIDIRFAPVNPVGEPVIFNCAPTGRPGIPGSGLKMPVPAIDWRPRPGGPSNSFVVYIRPEKEVIIDARTRADQGFLVGAGAHARPRTGEKFFHCFRVGPRPSAPKIAASRGGFFRS